MKVIKNAYPLYERFNNVQHGFMKALKMCISCLWVFQKLHHDLWRSQKKHLPCTRASTMCITVLWRPQKCTSPFYESFKNAHRLFLRLSKCASRFMKVAKKNTHLLCTSASIMCIMVLWRPFKTRISFLWGFQKFDSRFTKVWAICISFDERRKNFCIAIYGRA